jgi:prepilin-type N-terminal cleavage/methylation domain-containing protein
MALPIPTRETPARLSASRRALRRRSGFTLLETLLALVIVGIGILAFVDAQAAFYRSNNWSSRAATAMLLANEVRELSRTLPRHDPITGLTINSGALVGWGRETGETTVDDVDDLDDLDGVTFGLGGTFSGPVNANGLIVPQIDVSGVVQLSGGNPEPLRGWRQRVTVEKVDPYNFSTARADAYQQAASGTLPFIAVDSFPLRVTVSVEAQSLETTQWEEVVRTSWVVSP